MSLGRIVFTTELNGGAWTLLGELTAALAAGPRPEPAERVGE
jgi:hypothetical protein